MELGSEPIQKAIFMMASEKAAKRAEKEFTTIPMEQSIAENESVIGSMERE